MHPRVLAMAIATLFLKGSIFEDGAVRMTCEGAEIEGLNSTQLLMMWTLGSNCLVGWTVNSPHLRKPEKAVVVAASKLRWSSSEVWVADTRILLSTMQVMGILGLCSLSPIYLLIPLITRWSSGNSQVVKGRSVLT